MEVVASLSRGGTAAAQCGLFTDKSVPVIFEPPCSLKVRTSWIHMFPCLCGHDYPSEVSFISSSAYSVCFMLALRNKG